MLNRPAATKLMDARTSSSDFSSESSNCSTSSINSSNGFKNDENIENLLKCKINCFQHCLKSERLLCFQIPDKCPTCLKCLNTKNTKFLIPPFVLPTPLTLTSISEVSNSPCIQHLPSYSLLLQPTNGNYKNFLSLINQRQQELNHRVNDCESDDLDELINDFGDLHIGITNSKSEVFDFDLNGLSRNSIKWFKIPSIVIKLNHYHQTECIEHEYHYQQCESQQQKQQQQQIGSFPLVKESFNSLFYNYFSFNKWDLILDNYWYNERDTKWSAAHYNELKFNCLDFIIKFLIDYDYKFNINNENRSCNSTLTAEKTTVDYLKYILSRQLIEPEFIKCFKYLNLLIKIKKNGYFMEKIPSYAMSPSSPAHSSSVLVKPNKMIVNMLDAKCVEMDLVDEKFKMTTIIDDSFEEKRNENSNIIDAKIITMQTYL